jgi:hypothetical protein
MADEPEPDENDPEPSDGPIARWIRRLTELQKLFAAITAVIVGVAVLGGTVFGTVTSIEKNVTASPSTQASSSVGPAGSPSLVTTTIAPTTPPITSPPSLNISVTCKLPGPVREGQQTSAAYTITSNQSVKVGLGAAVYDSAGTDHSNGDGDVDEYRLVAGTQTVTRDLVLPSGLPADRYEVDAEIWPANEIGADNAEALADSPCGNFNVP